MLAFHPYGEQDIRVVSDLSRFEFEHTVPRNRSRNTTPTSLVSDSIFDVKADEWNRNPQRSKIEKEVFQNNANNNLPSRRKVLNVPSKETYEPQSEIYQYYMKPSTSNVNLDNSSEFTPYPTSIQDESRNTEKLAELPYISEPTYKIPSLPEKDDHIDIKGGVNNHDHQLEHPLPLPPTIDLNKELPVVEKPSEYFGRIESNSLSEDTKKKKRSRKRRNGANYPNSEKFNEEEYLDNASDRKSVDSRQKGMEEVLIKLVMNRPLFSFPLGKIINHSGFEGQVITITVNFVLYVFEIISAIIVITLSVILSNIDDDVSLSIYHYFIADQVLSLITALLFITTIINFEKRNGSFYCLATCLLTIVSFIMVNSTVLINTKCSASKTVCPMRKAVSSFIIISTFVWICDLVMFLTTLYISKLNLLNDINFDYSNDGVNNYTQQPTSQQIKPISTFDHSIDPMTGKQWPQYFMQSDGEIVEYDGTFDTNGIQRIIVYVPY